MSKYLEDFFEPSELKRIFLRKLVYSSSVGIDKINTKTFMNSLTVNAELIQRKMSNGTYKFTHYKQILISKGKGKIPRVVSVPGIRDRLALQRINAYLQKRYNKYSSFKLSQTLISEIISELDSKSYDTYIKIDMSDFYGTIDHSLLLRSLEKYRVSKKITSIIHKAINTPTVPSDSVKSDREEMNMVGVPQGLSISNVLASFYMLDIDKMFGKDSSLYYARYVDDILILCKKSDEKDIKRRIESKLVDELKLVLNTDKTKSGQLIDGFGFLGYDILGEQVMPRKRAVRGIERTIERLCRDYSKSKEKNEKYFLWKLNLKITGAISDNKKYGWLFYFSQITDLSVLFHLDWFVQKMFDRFGIEISNEDIKLKRFVRAFNEITLNLDRTNYILNLDKYNEYDMNDFLVNIYGHEDDIDVDEVEMIFKRVVFKSLSSLEKDLQTFS